MHGRISWSGERPGKATVGAVDELAQVHRLPVNERTNMVPPVKLALWTSVSVAKVGMSCGSSW